jgi:hypothetical protein
LPAAALVKRTVLITTVSADLLLRWKILYALTEFFNQCANLFDDWHWHFY